MHGSQLSTDPTMRADQIAAEMRIVYEAKRPKGFWNERSERQALEAGVADNLMLELQGLALRLRDEYYEAHPISEQLIPVGVHITKLPLAEGLVELWHKGKKLITVLDVCARHPVTICKS